MLCEEAKRIDVVGLLVSALPNSRVRYICTLYGFRWCRGSMCVYFMVQAGDTCMVLLWFGAVDQAVIWIHVCSLYGFAWCYGSMYV